MCLLMWTEMVQKYRVGKKTVEDKWERKEETEERNKKKEEEKPR